VNDDTPAGHARSRKSEPAANSGPEGKKSIRNPERGTRLSALEIHENINGPAEEEMERPASSLLFSSLAAGMLIAFSFLACGYVHSFVPEPYTDAAMTLVYPLGFLFVVMGRSELFTENTLEPVIPLLHNRDRETLNKMLRLWGILIVGNLLGALIVAWIAGHTAMMEDKLAPHFQEVAKNATEGGFGTVFYKAIFAGWLIALLAWLLASTQDTIAQIALIWLTTAPIHAFHFRHSIAGSVEAFYRAVTGTAAWGDMLGGFIAPALLGNAVGGVVLVALFNYAQVAEEHGKKKKRR
jgi:formate/nitrite transporter FocA (FNT family)